MSRRGTEDFTQSSRIILHDPTLVDTSHYAFVQTQECTSVLTMALGDNNVSP